MQTAFYVTPNPHCTTIFSITKGVPTMPNMPEFEYRFMTRKRGEKYQLIIAYKDIHGKWKQKSRTVEKSSEARSSIIRAEMIRSVKDELSLNTAYRNITLRDFTDFYCDQRTDLAVNTKMRYTNNVKVLRDIADIPIKDISYMDIAAQFSKLQYAENSMKSIYSTVRIIFRAAIRYRVITTSPAEEFEYKAKKQKAPHRIRTFTTEEMNDLMGKIMNPAILIILAICRYTGCRISEALGITWQDVDILRQTIRINKQYGVIDMRTRRYGFKPVKNTNGVRTVYIPAELARYLIEYKKTAPLTIDNRITVINSSAHVDTYIRKHAPRHSAHDFRHTFATTLLVNGADIRTIAALLGDTVAAVEHTYLNYTEEMRNNARVLLSHVNL